MVRAMKSPEPWNLMMEAVIPILRQVIGNADNQQSPTKRDPCQSIPQTGQKQRQCLETEIKSERLHRHVRNGEASYIEKSFILRPAGFVQPGDELDDSQRQNE